MDIIFDRKCSYQDAKLILLGVPWEVTASYGSGTAEGPLWIQKASSQMDFFDPQTKKNPSKEGIHFWYLHSLKEKNNELRPLAQKCIKNQNQELIKKVNQGCLEMIQQVKEKTKKILNDGKLIGLIGGDHSISEGFILEIAKKYKNDFGVLHLDAHADMRKSYQGFKHSHASVMYNVFHQDFRPRKIVQFGIRDLAEEEYQIISSHPDIHCFFDHEIKKQYFEGKTWNQIIQPVLKVLPEKIYISFDIDALSWSYAPNTGCPVPGGLSFDQAIYLMDELYRAGKKIIGFDLVEVSKPKSDLFGEWDGNVGARLAYKLCHLLF